METAGIEMKLNGLLIKKLRENRAWSQEHLATIAGVSLRTIQRVEKGESAAAETRMALASVFDIQMGDLECEKNPSASLTGDKTESSTGNLLAASRRRATIKHFVIYVFVCSVLIVLNLSQSGQLTWARYPLIIWGGILLIETFFHRSKNDD